MDHEKNRKNLRVRIIISILNFTENYEMLKLIQNFMGGRLAIERNNRYVTLILNKKSDLVKAFGVLAKYPLLTTRKQQQLNFALSCYSPAGSADLENFVTNRNNKYHNFNYIRNITDLDCIPYFKIWLSGFIEAEGNFSLILRDSGFIKKCQFNIGQNNDKFLLDLIKQYFNCSHAITADNNKINNNNNIKHYSISLGGPSLRLELIKHFNLFPLLGNKKTPYEK